MKKALVFGATGFIGKFLVQELLNHPAYNEVIVVVRKEPNIQNPKLKVITADLQSLAGVKQDLVADEVFIALGTTRKKTPDPKEYYAIDHDYPVLAAKFSKENGAGTVLLVSAVGADARSAVPYVRTKGETERYVIALQFKHTHIFRPSLLLGERGEHRPLEKIALAAWPAIEKVLVGKWNSYRGIHGQDVARAMVAAAQVVKDPLRIYHWSQMQMLSQMPPEEISK